MVRLPWDPVTVGVYPRRFTSRWFLARRLVQYAKGLRALTDQELNEL